MYLQDETAIQWMGNECPTQRESIVLLDLSTNTAMACGFVHEAMAAGKRILLYL
jgi:hypothetical protein